MSSFNFNLTELYGSYKDWVRNNPETANDVESTFKWVSYFVAGRINKSVVLTELVYSVSNLLVLFNDRIINASKQKLGAAGDQIKVWLTVLEYSEVFIEISAKTLWGKKGKWIIIVCVQLLKCAARLTLLLHYNERMLPCPPIPPIKRALVKQASEVQSADETTTRNNVAFCLKRSGRVIRKVEASPPVGSRMWKPPTIGPPRENQENQAPDKKQLKQYLTAEILYIVKPVAHLAGMLRYGEKSWKPWVTSVAMDLTSLYLFHKAPAPRNGRQLTADQKVELSRRNLMLLLYLMRSPFYEAHSQNRVDAFLDSLAKNIPLARLICNPIKQYIPYWQDTYFYLWSS